jgi:Family of unknown function (DUF6525)
MGNSNLRGASASYASTEKQMEAFDRLPASVRLALASAAFNWAPFPIRRRFEAGDYTAKELVKRIAKWDRDQITKDRIRVWELPVKIRTARTREDGR